MARPFLPHVITDDSALGGSVIERSLRFNKGDNAVLTRSPSTTTNSTKQTLSFWFKISSLIDATNQGVLFAGGSDGSYSYAQFWSNTFYFGNSAGPYWNGTLRLRDFSAWYHAVIVIDTTQSTADDRQKFYLNGVQQDKGNAGSNNPNQNDNYEFLTNSSWTYYIGKRAANDMNFDGYMSEINFVQGQALEPTQFGFTDGQTGIWMPKRYEGTYGTNGFYLDFSDNSSTAALGIDKSPNGNDFTTNNFSVSAGAGNDSLIDTPTNVFATLNPLVGRGSNYLTHTNGNLDFDIQGQSTYPKPVSTFNIPTSGKWYAEWVFTTIGTAVVGVGNVDKAEESGAASQLNGINYLYNGDIRVNDSFTQGSFTSWSANDVIGVKVDRDAGTIAFTLNGSAQGNPENISSMNTPTDLVFWAYRNSSGGSAPVGSVNFGQRPFSHLPSGYKSLCSQNLIAHSPAILDPQKHFDVLLYTPNSSSLTVDGLEFTPDLIWLKSRTQAYRHYWFDVVRGTGQKALSSDINVQEGDDAGSITSFNRGGFSIPGATGFNDNGSGTNGVVAWCWKAGGAAVSNTDGDITSSVSANQTAGFSIVTWTGNGSNSTVGHGLGKTPKWIICKLRDTTTQDWFFMTGEITGDRGKYMKFNESGGIVSDIHTFPPTAPTSTVFTVGGEDGGNSSNGNGSKYVAYCWAEIPGYSKFGKYTGNFDADGTFINLGFRPAFIMVKKSTDDNWYMADYKRDPENPGDHRIFADVATVEGGVGQEHFDFLSNGIKWRRAKNPFNNSDTFFFYMAFARRPGVTPFGTFPEAR